MLPSVLCLVVPDWRVAAASYALLIVVALFQLFGPPRKFEIKSRAKDERDYSLGRLGRYFVKRAEHGQTVD